MRTLLAEKYRPSKISEYIFQSEKVQKFITSCVKNKSIPNIMMIGDAGLGKTTLARLLKTELNVVDSDFKTIRCSSDTGVATIRDELEPWLKKAPLGSFKIVHLEEMDRLSKQAYDALKQPTEEFSSYVRFIATANSMSRIPAPLMSRFTMLDLNGINKDAVTDRVVEILEKEDIFPHNDDPEIIIAHVERYYPDFRKILNSIEECSPFDENGNGFRTLSLPMDNKKSNDLDQWEILCDADKLDPLDLLEITHLVDDANYDWFYTKLYDNIQHYQDPAMAIITIAKYLDMATRTANQRIILDACIYDLFFVES